MKYLKRFNEMNSNKVVDREALFELFDRIEDTQFKQKWEDLKGKLQEVTPSDIEQIKAVQTELSDANEGLKDNMKKLGSGMKKLGSGFVYSVGRLTNYITRVLGLSGIVLSLFTLVYGLITYFIETDHTDIVSMADREKFDFFFNILPSMNQYSFSGFVGALSSFILILLGEVPMIPYKKTMMDKVFGDDKLIPDVE